MKKAKGSDQKKAAQAALKIICGVSFIRITFLAKFQQKIHVKVFDIYKRAY